MQARNEILVHPNIYLDHRDPLWITDELSGHVRFSDGIVAISTDVEYICARLRDFTTSGAEADVLQAQWHKRRR